MPDEISMIVVSDSAEEEKSADRVVQHMFAAENCPAECPTCQQTCVYTVGHAGLHHCENGHEWFAAPR